jgi:hypothetical protein
LCGEFSLRTMKSKYAWMKSASQMKLNPPAASAISTDQREDFISRQADFSHPTGWIQLKRKTT